MVDEPAPPQHSAGGTALTGVLVAVWALADAPVGILIAVLAAYLNALVVGVVAAVVLSIINISCCTWLNREWDGWAEGAGKGVEKRISKMRSGKRMRKPVAWITSGSAGWYVAAACLTNAVQATALARVIGGQPVDARRLRLGAIGFSIFAAALFSVLGIAIRDVITAV